VESSIAGAESSLQMDHSSFKSTIEDQRTYVTDTVTSFTDSMHQITDKLQQQRQDIDHYLTAELQQDMPTGIHCLLYFLCNSFTV